MTKRKAYGKDPNFRPGFSPLSDAARAEVRALLFTNSALDEGQRWRIESDIELALGNYAPMAENIENPPIAEDYIAAMSIVRQQADELVKTLKSLDGWMATYLEGRLEHARHGSEMTSALDPVVAELKLLIDAAASAEESMKEATATGKSTRGRKRRTALELTICSLVSAFEAARPKPPSTPRKTNFDGRDTWESDLLRFLRITLDDARIPYARGDDRPEKYLRERLPPDLLGTK